MRALIIGLMIFSCAFVAMGEVYQMDRKGESTVEVNKSAGEYRVICKFRPQTKFYRAINAKFNDAKGDSLCKKGLARYLKISANETLTVAGLYSVAPVEKIGDKLCYSFAVPVSGCNVVNAGTKSKPAITSETSGASASDTPSSKTAVGTANKSSSYVCVARYKDVNGVRKTISLREYQGHNFKSSKEFDQFCQQEFARIRAQGDANLRAVRNFGK